LTKSFFVSDHSAQYYSPLFIGFPLSLAADGSGLIAALFPTISVSPPPDHLSESQIEIFDTFRPILAQTRVALLQLLLELATLILCVA
jgi:hypothetical protein